MILAGDVGGTKVDLALCNFQNGQLLTVHEHKYHAKDFPGLKEIVDNFLVECGKRWANRSMCWRRALECRARCAMAA